MPSLRQAAIRLAHSQPKGSKLRNDLLKVLATTEFDPDEIGDLQSGPLEGDSDEPFMSGEFTQQEFDELSDKQVGGDLPSADKAAGDAALRKATIRLAHENPSLRKHLLPLLKSADFDADQVGDVFPDGALDQDADEPYMSENFTGQEFDELSDKVQEDGLETDEKKYAGEEQLRKATIRLAHENPALRKHLLPLLKQAGSGDRYEVIEAKRWVNKTTGQTASMYGAVPWTRASEKSQWSIESVGWTVRDNRSGTIGIGRPPWKSQREAEAWAEKENARLSRNANKQAWGEKLRGGTKQEYIEVLRNAPHARKEYVEGGRRTMDVEHKDRGTVVAKKTIIYKRDGRTVESEHYLINPEYLDSGNPDERGW